MKIIKTTAAVVLVCGLMGGMAAHAAPANAKQFKNAMQHASHARLNKNGTNVLRFDADQDATMTEVRVVNSSLRVNAVQVDDSLIGSLDIEQDATVRQSTLTNSSTTLNQVDMSRARSITTDIEQDATLRQMMVHNASVTANTIAVR